jgi:hypothetical protein
MVHGVGSWASTCLDQLGLLVVVFALLCGRGLLSRSAKLRSDNVKVLLRTFLFSGAIIVLGILISGATNCRNRWLQPLLVPAPVLVAAWCQEQLSRRKLTIILLLAGAVALGVAIAAPGRIRLTERLGKKEILNSPFRKLAGQLQGPLAQAPLLYCNDAWLAGNLRIWFPGKAVTAPVTLKLYPPSPPCSLVWDPSLKKAEEFVAQAAPLTGRSPAEAIYFEERLKYHHTKTMRLGVLPPP